jgi:putative pyruvate formate lyase activating enzyme
MSVVWQRGLLVRHLVMPEKVAGTASVAAFLAGELAPDTYVNLMAQYHPAGKVNSAAFCAINRCTTPSEYAEGGASCTQGGFISL